MNILKKIFALESFLIKEAGKKQSKTLKGVNYNYAIELAEIKNLSEGLSEANKKKVSRILEFRKKDLPYPERFLPIGPLSFLKLMICLSPNIILESRET